MVSDEYLRKKSYCRPFFKDLCIVLRSLIMFGCHSGIQAQENMTSSLTREFINVQDVEPLSIGPQPNSILAVVGRLSMTVSLEP